MSRHERSLRLSTPLGSVWRIARSNHAVLTPAMGRFDPFAAPVVTAGLGAGHHVRASIATPARPVGPLIDPADQYGGWASCHWPRARKAAQKARFAPCSSRDSSMSGTKRASIVGVHFWTTPCSGRIGSARG